MTTSEEVAKRAHKELSDWIISHVLNVDAQIGVCYRKANPKHDVVG